MHTQQYKKGTHEKNCKKHNKNAKTDLSVYWRGGREVTWYWVSPILSQYFGYTFAEEVSRGNSRTGRARVGQCGRGELEVSTGTVCVGYLLIEGPRAEPLS